MPLRLWHYAVSVRSGKSEALKKKKKILLNNGRKKKNNK